MRTDFIYVFVPSLFSLLACFLLILSVAVQPPLRDRMYHKLSVALASTQIVMYSSRILDRNETPLTVCKIQDYLFQFGQCLCAVTVTVINAYVFYVLYTTTLPDTVTFSNIYAGLVLFCVVNIGIAACFDISVMFCENDEDTSLSSEDFDNGTYTQGVVFKVTYFYPLLLMFFINITFCCFCIYQLIYRVEENRFKLPLLKRLLTFTIIFIVCGLPKIVSMFLFDDIHLFANISDCIIHMSGVFLSGSYFYYAVVQDKKRWQTKSLLRDTLMQTSTPADLEESHGIDDYSSYCPPSRCSSTTLSTFRTVDMVSVAAGSFTSTAPSFANDDNEDI